MKKNIDPSGNSFLRSDAGGIFDLIFYNIYVVSVWREIKIESA
jgi:hypothetical protein